MTDAGGNGKGTGDASIDAYMPLWIGDYLADTMHLSYGEHGAYLLLIMAHWSSGPLPDDHEQLARIARVPIEIWCDSVMQRVQIDGVRTVRRVPSGRKVAEKWQKSGSNSATILPGMCHKIATFFRIEGGRWIHDRVMKERARAIENKQFFSDRGRELARRRWDKPKPKPDAGRIDKSMRAAMPPPIEEIRVTDVTLPLLSGNRPSLRSGRSSSLPENPGNDDLLAGVDPNPPGKVEAGPPRCPVRDVVELWHRTLPALPRMERITPAREANIRQRWREWAVEKRWTTTEQGLAEWETFFRWIGQSAFLTGRAKSADPSKPPFLATLEWVMLPRNHVRIFEGQYHG